VRWAEDCAVPVGHEKIIALVQAVGACLCVIVSLLVEGVLFSRKAVTTRMYARMFADRRTVRTGSETFLALLQLLQQAEVTRYFCAHGCVFVGCDRERAVVSCWCELATIRTRLRSGIGKI
jgi:hypothetical protein